MLQTTRMENLKKYRSFYSQQRVQWTNIKYVIIRWGDIIEG